MKSSVDIDISRRSMIAPKCSILPRTSSCVSGRRTDNRVVINVGGIRYETYRSTLKNIPDTRLSWLTNTRTLNSDFHQESGEFFFDRHPGVFNMILNYYRTGKLHAPTDVCGPLFEEELAFWGLDEKQIEPCCWSNYRAHRDAQETLAEMDGGDVNTDTEEDTEMSHLDDIREKFGIIEEHISEDKSWWRRYQPRIWRLLDEPKSSKSSRVYAVVSFIFILTSIMSFCMESHIQFRERLSPSSNSSIATVRDKEMLTKPMLFLEVTEYVCVSFFSLEIIFRILFCPSRTEYFKQVFNWIDISVVIPCFLCYLIIATEPEARGESWFRFLSALRLIRIFRIFKLTLHVSGLKILGHTIKASAKELLLLILVLIIGVLIFACLIYYAEQVDEAELNNISNIPLGFWWAVVTMTTLGYGDLYPRTALGYIIGTVCAVCGLLMLSLPVPVIVSNFTLYYTHAQAREKLPKKSKKTVLLNAANALVDPDSREASVDEAAINDLPTSYSKESIERTSSDDSAIGSSYEKVKVTPDLSYRHKRRPIQYLRKLPHLRNGRNGRVGISVIFADETIRSRTSSLESMGVPKSGSLEDARIDEDKKQPVTLSPQHLLAGIPIRPRRGSYTPGVRPTGYGKQKVDKANCQSSTRRGSVAPNAT